MIYTLISKDIDDNIKAIISFDAVTSFDESWSATVTTQTVEKGFNISDNVNVEPPTYSIDAIISSYSLFNIENEIVWDGREFVGNENSQINSHIIARDELISLFKDRSIITVAESTNNSNALNPITKHEELQGGHYREIENCIINSLSIGHPDSGTGAFYVSLKIQQIFTATVFITELPEGEATPSVRPLLAEEKNEGSSLSKEGKGGGAGGEGELDTPEAPKDEDIESEKAQMGVGKTQAQGEKEAAKVTAKLKYELKALEQARAEQSISGQNRKIVYVNGGWETTPTN